nr:hypothetical protein [Tanacetum cinerariifolium]
GQILHTNVESVDGIHSQVSSSKLTTRGKEGRGKNICYIKYLSLIMEHLMGENYLDENLKLMKPHQITKETFKDSNISEVPLTSYMLKVVKLSASDDLNEDAKDKSLSGTIVNPESPPKTKTDKKRRKKKSYLLLNHKL